MRGVGLALLLAGAAWAAAPPARLTPAQAEKLEQRDRLWAEAQRLDKAGSRVEARAALRRVLALEREVLGRAHPAVARTLAAQFRLAEAQGDWKGAVAAIRERAGVFARLYGERDFRAVEARLVAEDTELRSRLTPGKRQELARAWQLNAQVVSLQGRGKMKEALAAAEEAAELVMGAAGEKHPLYALSVLNVGSTARAMGDHRRALPLLERAVKLYREAVGPGHPHYASALINLAVLHQDRWDHRRALPLLQQAMKVYGETLGEGHKDYLAGLLNLAGVYRALGDYGESRALYERLERLSKEVLGEKHPLRATVLWHLSSQHGLEGDYRRAFPMHRQALGLFENSGGPGHPDYITCLRSLGVLHREVGEYREALPILRRALELARESQGESHPDYAIALNAIALLYYEMGEHRLALPLYRQALRLRKAASGERHPEYATTLNNLASLYRDMGDHRRALPLAQQVVRLLRESPGERHPKYAVALNNLGSLYTALGERRQALLLFRQALKVAQDAHGERHPVTALALGNLGQMHKDLGEYPQALAAHRRALKLWEAAAPRHPNRAVGLLNLAGLYEVMGEPRQALPLAWEALALRKEGLGGRHPLYAEGLEGLAALYLEVGKAGQAAALAGQALAVRELHLADFFHVLSDRQRRELAGEYAGSLELFLTLAEDLLPPAALYAHVAAWKGAAGEAEGRFVRDNPDLLPLLEELRDVRVGLARLANQPAGAAGQAAWRHRFDELDRRKDELQGRLAQASAAFARRQQKPTADAVRAALPAGTALVELLSYRHASYTPGPTGGAWRREPRLLAFVLRAGREPALVRLGPAEPIFRAARLWGRSATAPGDGVPDPAAADLLRRKLWEPIARHVAGAKAVLVAPDDELCGLPFAALPGGKPGSFLLEEHAIGYLTSGRQLLEPAGEAATTGLLAAGGLDFGAAHEVGDPLARPRSWRRLPGTEVEARRVEAAFRSQAGPVAARLLTGRGADRAGLLAALGDAAGRPRYLHLATHGFFERGRPGLPPAVLGAWAAAAGRAGDLAGMTGALSAALAADEPGALDREGGFDPTGRSYRVQRSNPMLASCLVLSRVNEAGEEGYLSAEEIASLDLRGCELATLSACETGAGALAGWQGVQGLQRGFHDAGARHVLASLWNVSDAATSVLMEEFYRRLWKEKRPPREALRLAQLHVLRHPAEVTARARELGAVLAKRGVPEAELASRGLGKAAALGPTARSGEPARSPVAWWAAWVLSGR
jgi:CHAT domain-containing protein/tetratricopeptide (TPR) repeat protein